MAYTPPFRDDTTGYYRADPQITETATVLAKAYCPYCSVQVGEASGSRLDLSHLVGAVADHVAKAHTPQTAELQAALRANKGLTELNVTLQETVDRVQAELSEAGLVGDTTWNRVRKLRLQRDQAQRSLYAANEEVTKLKATIKAYDHSAELVEKVKHLIDTW